MHRIERAQRERKRLQRSREDMRRELDQRHTADDGSGLLAMRSAWSAGMNPNPQLILEHPARNQRLAPQRFRRRTILSEEMGERDRGVEIDHRSSRSRCNSSMRVLKGMTGLRGRVGQRQRHLSAAHGLGEHRVRRGLAPSGAPRRALGDDAVAIGAASAPTNGRSPVRPAFGFLRAEFVAER
jgi:hypothetical protein